MALGRRRTQWLPRLLALFGVVLLIWLGGLIWFAANLPHQVDNPDRETDAIVVLTGGSGRVAQGIELLAEGRGQKLFISGVYRGVDVDALLNLVREEPENLVCCIALGYRADNTRGNALETAKWLRENDFRSLRLVTASYHMPRSLLEFHRVMPDIVILPHPVFSDNFKQSDWWLWPGSAYLLASEYSKYLLVWIRTEIARLLT